VKKIISIGVALAVLAMVVVPVAVTADGPSYNSTPDKAAAATYSKIPFGILGTLINLFADQYPAIDAALGINMTWIGDVLGAVGNWSMGPFSWLSDLTGWTMVAVGDVISKAQGIITALAPNTTLPLGSVAQMFYILGARIFDASDALPGNISDTYWAGFGVNASL
jgi:hypothetical protein